MSSGQKPRTIRHFPKMKVRGKVRRKRERLDRMILAWLQLGEATSRAGKALSDLAFQMSPKKAYPTFYFPARPIVDTFSGDLVRREGRNSLKDLTIRVENNFLTQADEISFESDGVERTVEVNRDFFLRTDAMDAALYGYISQQIINPDGDTDGKE